MSKYVVRIWCSDCLNEDPYGCFDGGSEYIRERSSDEEPKVFKSLQTALKYGENYIDGTIWEYQVEYRDKPRHLLIHRSTPLEEMPISKPVEPTKKRDEGE